MSLSQLSSNILHHVCSTVSIANAWKSPSSKVTGTVFFTAAQALAFYLFATVDNFSFPITTHYLALRGRFTVRNPDTIFGFSNRNHEIMILEQILFNSILRTELAVDDRIRGDRDRPRRHTMYHDLTDLGPCPCSSYPRLGIFPCYPLLIRLIKPTLQLGYRLYRYIEGIFLNDHNLNRHIAGLYEPILLNLGPILGMGFAEGPLHGATTAWCYPHTLVWLRDADDERLFIDLRGLVPPINTMELITREGLMRMAEEDN